jgi:transposase
MRKGFEGLSALVRQEFRRDVMSGELYLFTNKHRKRAKVWHWDGTGLCLYSKRLEKRGRFACLWKTEAAGSVEMTVTELALFLEGSELVGRVPLSPTALGVEALVSRM